MRVLQYQSGMDLQRGNRKRDLAMIIILAIKFTNKIVEFSSCLSTCVFLYYFYLMQNIVLADDLSLLLIQWKMKIAKDVS